MKGKNITSVLGEIGLSEEVQAQITEAWNEAVEKNKEDALNEARQEVQSKFDGEVQTMVAAAESLIRNTLESELKEFSQDRKKVYEAKKALLSNLKKSRALKESYEEKFNKKVEVFENFVMQTLKDEIVEFKQDRDQLQESIQKERLKLKKEQMRQRKLSESKEKAFTRLINQTLRGEMVELAEDRKKFNESINRMESLVVRQLTEELSEFQEDRQKLNEKRVELESEHNKKLEESKKIFFKRASAAAEKLVNETLNQEISGLKEDIREAKENKFARKIFEAFSSEFLFSHLAENTEVGNMRKKLETVSKNAEKLQKIVQEQKQMINKSRKELKESRENGIREKEINTLIRSLPEKKQSIMRNLLEGVETKNIKSAFDKYLPSVLDTQGSTQPKRTLKEGRKQRTEKPKYKEVTGQREGKERFDESIKSGNEEGISSTELEQILTNAGIKLNK